MTRYHFAARVTRVEERAGEWIVATGAIEWHVGSERPGVAEGDEVGMVLELPAAAVERLEAAE